MDTENNKEENNFSWDNPETISFFGEDLDETPTTTEDVLEEVNKDDDVPLEEGEKPKEEGKEDNQNEEEEFSFTDFAEPSNDPQKEIEEAEEGDEEEETEPSQTVGSASMSTFNFLKDKGLLEFKLKEGQELTDELAEEMIEEQFDQAIENKFKEVFEETDPLLREMATYVVKGGKAEDFISKYKTSVGTEITVDTDITKEENQIKVLETILRKDETYSEEDIQNQIEYYKDSGKLEKFATSRFNAWKKQKEAFAAEQVQKQQERLKEEKALYKQHKESLKSFVSENRELKGFNLSDKDVKDLPSYMSDRTYKLKGGGQITALQKDLAEALQDKEKSAVLAKILRSDFDFSELIDNAVSKNNRKINKQVRQTSQANPRKGKRVKSTKNMTLIDALGI